MNRLDKIYNRSDITYEDGNYVFYKSKSPILLQAHVDTVRDEKKDLIIYGDKILYANGVLGADDRAGIYAMLKVFELHKEIGLPNILLTNHEETGGRGMKVFTDKVKAKKLNHINLCIALDRQGVGEYVTYNELPDEVDNYMNWFGFIEHEGSFSDCQIFCSKYKIPSVNVSVGYHHQHTASECLHMDELYLTIDRLADIMVSPISTRYETTGNPKWEFDNTGWGRIYDTNKYYDGWKGSDYCEFCGEKVNKCYYDADSQMYLCNKCYDYVGNSLKGGAVL